MSRTKSRDKHEEKHQTVATVCLTTAPHFALYIILWTTHSLMTWVIHMNIHLQKVISSQSHDFLWSLTRKILLWILKRVAFLCFTKCFDGSKKSNHERKRRSSIKNEISRNNKKFTWYSRVYDCIIYLTICAFIQMDKE